MTRESVILNKINKKFQPIYLEVINESYMHSVPEGSESHFKLIIVSNYFKDKKRIERQREVNSLLMDEFSKGLHALTQQIFTEDEWKLCDGNFNSSPHCTNKTNK